jgi:hypothetical protein
VFHSVYRPHDGHCQEDRDNRTLRMTPAMAAGVTNRLWEVEDLVALWEARESLRAAA